MDDDKKPIAIIASAIVLFLAVGAWWMSRDTKAPPASQNATPPAAVAGTEAVIPKTEPLPLELPPMEGMDAFLRPLLGALSSRP